MLVMSCRESCSPRMLCTISIAVSVCGSRAGDRLPCTCALGTQVEDLARGSAAGVSPPVSVLAGKELAHLRLALAAHQVLLQRLHEIHGARVPCPGLDHGLRICRQTKRVHRQPTDFTPLGTQRNRRRSHDANADQSDAGTAGIFSRGTNHTQEARGEKKPPSEVPRLAKRRNQAALKVQR
eukprot:7510694-Pyramimonas_sp.AAC.1